MASMRVAAAGHSAAASIPSNWFQQAGFQPEGELHVKARQATGLRAIIAIHSTRLGPEIRPPAITDRRAYFRAFGRFVDSFHGRFVTGEDAGTVVADIDAMAEVTDHVVGGSASGGDRSPYTALGVLSAIQTAARYRLHRGDLDG